MNTTIAKGNKIFLIDASGAIVSIFALVFPYSYEIFFGMPKSTVLVFIAIAMFCALYSFTVYYTVKQNWRPYLTIIALINISYCFFTAYHLYKNMNSVTRYGYFYFFIEILIILTLSAFELNNSRSKSEQ